MQDFLDQFLKTYLKDVFGEGGQILKIKGLTAALQVLQGVRKLALLNYVINILCMTWTLSFFASAFQIFFQQDIVWNAAFIFSSSTCLFSTLLLYLSIREKSWLEASGLKRMIEDMESCSSQNKDFHSKESIDQEVLLRRIESLIDRKIAESLQVKQQEAQPTNDSSTQKTA